MSGNGSKQKTGEAGGGSEIDRLNDFAVTITPGLYACLALKQHRLNQAVGIKRLTPQVERYLTCYNVARQREYEVQIAENRRLFKVSFLSNLIQDVARQIHGLVERAEREAGAGNEAQVRLIAAEVERLKKLLDGLEANLSAVTGEANG